MAENYLPMLASSEALKAFAKIDQYGRFTILEGTHRSAVNYVLGYKRVPFGILSRDRAWVDFVAFFREEGERIYKNSNKIYYTIAHPARQ